MFYKSMNACSYELGSNGTEPMLTLTVFSQYDDSGHSKYATAFSLCFKYHLRSCFWPNVSFASGLREFSYPWLGFRSSPL